MLALDGSVSPYLPTKEILAALATSAEATVAPESLARMLRARLALLHGISVDRIALIPQDERRLEGLANLCRDKPWVVYPPGTRSLGVDSLPVEPFEVERSDRFRIERPQIEATPVDAIALVMTPSDPTGNAIVATTAAQLGRRASLLVLDEHSAEMQRRSMLPLVEEFDSIVLLRSFSDWAGLGEHAPDYAIGSKRIANAIDRSSSLSTCGLHAALAAVSNAPHLDAIAHRVRLERLRLYRMLRKLNFLSPFPSDGGYVLAEVTRGDRDEIALALAEREITVYAPPQPRLARTLRFSAISPAATRTLQCALVDISRTVPD